MDPSCLYTVVACCFSPFEPRLVAVQLGLVSSPWLPSGGGEQSPFWRHCLSVVVNDSLLCMSMRGFDWVTIRACCCELGTQLVGNTSDVGLLSGDLFQELTSLAYTA